MNRTKSEGAMKLMIKMSMAAMIGGVVVCAGCANTEKAPYAAKRDTLATTTTPAGQDAWGLAKVEGDGRREYPQVVVEYGLREYITIGEPRVQSGEILKVTVPTRLLADEDEQARIQYRFIFFGNNGVPLRDQPDWRYIQLEPRTQVFLSANSTDTASDWRLEIRSNR